MFAATPLLEALQILLSLALTEGTGYMKGREEEGMNIEFIDIKRAYLQAVRQEGRLCGVASGRWTGRNVRETEESDVRDEGRSTELGSNV